MFCHCLLWTLRRLGSDLDCLVNNPSKQKLFIKNE